MIWSTRTNNFKILKLSGKITKIKKGATRQGVRVTYKMTNKTLKTFKCFGFNLDHHQWQ